MPPFHSSFGSLFGLSWSFNNPAFAFKPCALLETLTNELPLLFLLLTKAHCKISRWEVSFHLSVLHLSFFSSICYLRGSLPFPDRIPGEQLDTIPLFLSLSAKDWISRQSAAIWQGNFSGAEQFQPWILHWTKARRKRGGKREGENVFAVQQRVDSHSLKHSYVQYTAYEWTSLTIPLTDVFWCRIAVCLLHFKTYNKNSISQSSSCVL